MATPSEHGGIIRTVKDAHHPYVMIARQLAQDNRLSFEARGLMLYVLSKPDNWEVQTHDLQTEGDVGRDQLRRIMKELQAAGYMARYKEHVNGRWRWVTLIYEVAQPSLIQGPENPSIVQPPEKASLVQGPEKQAVEKQATENTSIYIIENEQNTDQQSKEGGVVPLRHTPPVPAVVEPFDELTPARLSRQTAQATRATLACNAIPPEPCPAWGDLSPVVRDELVTLLTPYSDEPEPIVRRQVAWFRRGRGKERRLRAEWVQALRGVVQDEIDLRLPTGPLRAATARRTNTIPLVENWN